MYRIGIDLGGTNIAAGVEQGGRLLATASVKTNRPTNMDRLAADMTALVDTLLKETGLTKDDIASVGVGVPCPANQETGEMEFCDQMGFPSAPLVSRLSDALGLPIFFDNDANCAAWAEYQSGGYRGESFILVTLGTGIGGGIIVNGQLLRGCNFSAGELGHMVIRSEGRPCVCGRRGCWETYASASALAWHGRLALEAHPESLYWSLCGDAPEKAEAKPIFDAAQTGDEAAKLVLDEYAEHLADGLANLINVFAPEVLCIGGGVCRAGELLLDPVREKTMQRIYAKNTKKITRIELARLGNDAGIIGAAMLE